jgi:hypothetical protein
MTAATRWQAVVVIADHRTRYPLTIGTDATAAEASAAAAYAAGAGEWHAIPSEVTP